jgi:hypothetical protein
MVISPCRLLSSPPRQQRYAYAEHRDRDHDDQEHRGAVDHDASGCVRPGRATAAVSFQVSANHITEDDSRQASLVFKWPLALD